MIKNRCKYCGKMLPSERSWKTHESACPEMKYFADFALSNSDANVFDRPYKAIIGGIETANERIVKIVINSRTGL